MIEYFKKLNEASLFFLDENTPKVDELIFELNAQTIAQNLRLQTISKLSKLTAAIANQTDSDSEAAAKDKEIREIFDRKEAHGWNHVSKFYEINKLHPKPWVFVGILNYNHAS